MGFMNKPDRTFYLAWIILTAFCFPIGLFIINGVIILPILTTIIGDYIYVDGVRHITQDYWGIITGIPLVGLLTGIVQLGLLRRYLPRIGWWVLVTFGGWLLGLVLILISAWLNSWTYGSYNLYLVLIVLGLSIGVGQWLLLRQRLLRAGWWIGANLLGWFFSGLIIGENLSQGGIFALAFFPACVTAAMLAWLLNQTQPSELYGV